MKPSKKTPATAPAISKRITSTAANASIAIPAMEMNATGPDVMASVMSGMGTSGLGAGGPAGMAAMPLTGMTAFGFKGTPKTKGLVGKSFVMLFDLTASRIDLDRIVDEINRRMGDLKNPVITLASQGTMRSGKGWRMRPERHSPH